MTLYPVVGLDEDGGMYIYMSPFKLHKFSPMHLRGKPPPDGCVGRIDPEKVESALKKLINYYSDYDSRKKKK